MCYLHLSPASLRDDAFRTLQKQPRGDRILNFLNTHIKVKDLQSHRITAIITVVDNYGHIRLTLTADEGVNANVMELLAPLSMVKLGMEHA